MFLNYHFGEALQKYLNNKGIQQKWLADQLGISSQAVLKYFATENPRKDTLTKILKALEVTLEEFNRVAFKEDVISEPPIVYNTQGQGMTITMEQFQYFMQAVKERDELKQKEIEKLQEQNQGVTPQELTTDSKI